MRFIGGIMTSTVTDILNYSYNKDAANLMPALDDIMTSKIQDQIELMRKDVAASFFGNTTGEEEVVPQEETTNDHEGTEADVEVA